MTDLENNEREELLDLSWVEEEEKYLDSKNYEMCQLESIPVWYVYVSSKMVVEKREIETVKLDVSDNLYSVLDKDVLLQLVQSHKHNHKYKLMDIQLFHLPLNNENVQAFSSQTNPTLTANTYLKPINVLNNVSIEPTIRLLHEISAIYIFYKECEQENIVQIKSILKSSGGNGGITKKVRILCDNTDLVSVPKQVVMRRKLTRKKR
jgi:hypothetical protein